jgi:hypothetical protein
MKNKIKVCTQFFNQPPLDRSELHGAPEKVYFDHDIFQVVVFQDFHPDEKNYLSLTCRPQDTVYFLQKQNKKFYQDCIKNNVNFVFCHEGWNLFMIDDNIFKEFYDLNDLLYWQIVNVLKNNGISEQKVFFIHGAGGYIGEVDRIKNNKVLWTNSPIDLQSKHLELPLYLPWAQRRQADVATNLKYHFACLFAGRPAQHRHDLIKNLWQKELLRQGKISLTKMPDDSAFGKLPDMVVDKHINLHQSPAQSYNENYLFEDIFLWVAGETAVPNKYPNFSEKTVRAMLYQRPFALLGNAHSLAYLRKFGFKTFNDFWDESYDLDLDFGDRIAKVSKIIEDICDKDLHTLRIMLNDMQPILQHNKKILMETDWIGHVVKFLS